MKLEQVACQPSRPRVLHARAHPEHPSPSPAQGFNPANVGTKYGDQLYFWDWTTKELIQKVRGALGALCKLLLATPACPPPPAYAHMHMPMPMHTAPDRSCHQPTPHHSICCPAPPRHR